MATKRQKGKRCAQCNYCPNYKQDGSDILFSEIRNKYDLRHKPQFWSKDSEKMNPTSGVLK